jgi:phenylacetate-CoA ligase
VVRGFPEIDEFQCVLTTIDALDTLVIKVEPRPDLAEPARAELRERFRAEVKRQLSLNPVVELAAPGALPRFEMKARRFTDAREAAPA